MAGFNAISLKLKEMYQMITLGGDAELELVDSLDPFSEVCRPYQAQTVFYFSREADCISNVVSLRLHPRNTEGKNKYLSVTTQMGQLTACNIYTPRQTSRNHSLCYPPTI